ncbi:MAG: peptidoglycan-binding protein [Herpetosiphonaceae bacterium]|nr:peptidoglycan-binding protein [Herpetosiphonaceae bacterium]
MRVLKRGQSGKDVKIWQKFLNDNNFPVGEDDGWFGKKTDEATKRFQAEHKLFIDGIVGPETLQKAKALGFVLPKDRNVIPIDHPPFRRLRAYAFDPSLSIELENAVINQVTLQVLWEDGDQLRLGPIGEYVEVIDIDPASQCFYAPVDLNQPYMLAQDGLAPSEGNPQFHQQMVYGVAMTTIQNFERALGRKVLWAPHRWIETDEHGKQIECEEYMQRLRIYPHALREANAYYSPRQIALLFGYFPATTTDPRFHLPGGTVFTCLSHDIIAHETTHALLDGIHRRYDEPTNVDMLAFHEAFADIVALFQHFSYPEVLRHQIAKASGDLSTETLLAQLAQQFGKASSSHALRDALGDDKNGEWTRSEPEPAKMQTVTEPHERGSLLVAAIFDAFVSMYKTRTADLLRIATRGTGVLPGGRIHPDLVNRLADEAAAVAQHLLMMCIRALDYCPPVDLNFGDYLRALITADSDLVPDDTSGYRIAVIEAFRQRGIFPHNVRSLGIDTLLWNKSDSALWRAKSGVVNLLKEKRDALTQRTLTSAREDTYITLRDIRVQLHDKLREEWQNRAAVFKNTAKIYPLGSPHDTPLAAGLDPDLPFEVHSIRPAYRVGPDDNMRLDLVIEITQWRPGCFDRAAQDTLDEKLAKNKCDRPETGFDFKFRGGCTLLVDADCLVDTDCFPVRYEIFKPIWGDAADERLQRQRQFLTDTTDGSLSATYFGTLAQNKLGEPFRLLHRMASEEEFV